MVIFITDEEEEEHGRGFWREKVMSWTKRNVCILLLRFVAANFQLEICVLRFVIANLRYTPPDNESTRQSGAGILEH
ncbi:hypothetical protein L1987_03604 [Smallanthus sonchifolius]|uniref:Uncharacterized protein n=1 Tax=Smallanthus sonchifolius TaxID=185202 RepID=A0ACB9KB93_9ASTR|nr:hypothetical protein L1987_03604 [Smallanthus sonchifolius]